VCRRARADEDARGSGPACRGVEFDVAPDAHDVALAQTAVDAGDLRARARVREYARTGRRLQRRITTGVIAMFVRV
jgi:hypothetical protein